ncbi:FG-GAP repeat domain-containing protein [Roseivirga sp.]|uniref:FG-GAP repeat domain-containing protein n=1 Tax=Roseivirga sp. TaxID=1964215 RepID=UPI003B8B891D
MLQVYRTNRKRLLFTFSVILGICLFFSCGSNETIEEKPKDIPTETTPPVFSEVSYALSGINFINTIRENETHNFFNYNYIYNGSGLAVADFNNDDLQDVYFVSNQFGAKLFLNRGKLKFRNVTDSAGVNASEGWKNGVTIVDINNDGFKDIYVSRSGRYEKEEERTNLLYVNNGDLTFTEQSKTYGLDDPGYGVQAYFFDFDRDGDLDMYQVNHRIDFENKNTINMLARTDDSASKYARDRLYENRGGKYRDISDKAGIVNNAWGLSAVLGDFNEDGWDDIYVANDYLMPDYLYINQGNGTFKESIGDHFNHISFYSMGSDWADIDNTGHFDLFTLDMAPEDHVRSKRLMAAMSNDVFWTMVDQGYQHQYMVNTLQYNHGKGNFSEVSQLAGISKTDWSWTALFGDYDADGLKDLFVTNGIRKDITDNDAMTATDKLSASGNLKLGQVLNLLPSAKLQNPIFKNRGSLNFDRSNDSWGMKNAYNSNGGVYADLDNDGDLEILTNNMDLNSSLFKNLTVENTGRKLKRLKVIGPKENRDALGTTLKLVSEDGSVRMEKIRGSRGYLSNSDPSVFIADTDKVKEVHVIWPTGKTSIINLTGDDLLEEIDYNKLEFVTPIVSKSDTYFTETKDSKITYSHRENDFDDFIDEILLPHRQSEHGPFISKADVNKDGLEDVFIGGAKGQSASLYVQQANGQFKKSSTSTFSNDKGHEDMNSVFFDVDGDNDLDLYVVSGSGEMYNGANALLRDRLYLNDGNGNFEKSPQGSLPNDLAAGSKALPTDLDDDGDVDLIVLNRNVPGKYPSGPKSFIYENNNGRFVNATKQFSNDFFDARDMLVDGTLTDLDGNGHEDLIVVGEWTSPKIYLNNGDELELASSKFDDLKGWWNRIVHTDIDNDGDMDFVIGNVGLNNKYHPTAESPLYLFYNDFDDNGLGDIVLSKSNGGELLPVRGRECSSQQMPFILQKFDNYEKFANADLTAIYTEERLDESLKLEVNNFASGVLVNNGDMEFDFVPFPALAQFGSMKDIILKDVNNDGLTDFITAGNFYGAEVETVRYDANMGSIILNKGNGAFEVISQEQAGLYLKSDVRDLATITIQNDEYLIVASNNDELKTYKATK